MIGHRLLLGDGPRYSAWNFGPAHGSGASVRDILETARAVLPRICVDIGTSDAARKESNLLQLDSSKARADLGWRPLWEAELIERTIGWYKAYYEEGTVITNHQIRDYEASI